MSSGQHNGNVWLAAAPNKSVGVWVPSGPWAPDQILHLAVVVVPDPEQPALDRAVLTPYRHLHGSTQRTLLTGWSAPQASYAIAQQTAHEPEIEHRGETLAVGRAAPGFNSWRMTELGGLWFCTPLPAIPLSCM